MLTSFHLNPEVTNPDTLFDAGDPMKMMGFQSLFEKCEVSGILFFSGNEKEKILTGLSSILTRLLFISDNYKYKVDWDWGNNIKEKNI